MAYNRYQKLNRNGLIRKFPNIKLTEKATDVYIKYERGLTRLDNVSQRYYGDPGYDWLILMANSGIADMEYDIPEGTAVRVPLPLETTIRELENKIDLYDAFYGL